MQIVDAKNVNYMNGIMGLKMIFNKTSSGLTPALKRVLFYEMQFMSQKEIAAKLFITEKTVKAHLTLIYRHYGCKNRYELFRVFYQKQLKAACEAQELNYSELISKSDLPFGV